MRDVTICDYIGLTKELTAAEVRKLPLGTHIIRHHFDRYGNHVWAEMAVVKSGTKTMLKNVSYMDYIELTPIKKESNRICYTEVG